MLPSFLNAFYPANPASTYYIFTYRFTSSIYNHQFQISPPHCKITWPCTLGDLLGETLKNNLLAQLDSLCIQDVFKGKQECCSEDTLSDLGSDA
jgi:hypothetical protein